MAKRLDPDEALKQGFRFLFLRASDYTSPEIAEQVHGSTTLVTVRLAIVKKALRASTFPQAVHGAWYGGHFEEFLIREDAALLPAVKMPSPATMKAVVFLANGFDARSIAFRMNNTESTVRSLIEAARNKFRVRSSPALIHQLWRYKIFPEADNF